jgi:hypothetical protein
MRPIHRGRSSEVGGRRVGRGLDRMETASSEALYVIRPLVRVVNLRVRRALGVASWR